MQQILQAMWNDYIDLNPEAMRVFKSFTDRGEKVLNDHIALRTFKHPRLGLEQMAQVFKRMGYEEKGEYVFKDKKLYAKHYEFMGDKTQPKIFISELELEHFSQGLRDIVHKLVAQIPEQAYYREDFSYMGRPWSVSYQDYLKLAEESEYAAWLAAIGFRPNHFTVNVNHLSTFKDVGEVNQFLKQQGFKLNASGGEIKGSPQDLLEQSSTMANKVPVHFTDGTFTVPGCYYEFALRHKKKDGELYTGFVAASADKIFESTNRH